MPEGHVSVCTSICLKTGWLRKIIYKSKAYSSKDMAKGISHRSACWTYFTKTRSFLTHMVKTPTAYYNNFRGNTSSYFPISSKVSSSFSRLELIKGTIKSQFCLPCSCSSKPIHWTTGRRIAFFHEICNFKINHNLIYKKIIVIRVRTDFSIISQEKIILV